MHRDFPRQVDSLSEIFEFIQDFVTWQDISDTDAFAINLMVEELFTNMVKHNPGKTREITVALERDGEKARISLTDPDADPFDITQAKDVDIRKSLKQRRAGGLGIHLVKQLADDIHYEYTGRQSKITLVKVLERADV